MYNMNPQKVCKKIKYCRSTEKKPYIQGLLPPVTFRDQYIIHLTLVDTHSVHKIMHKAADNCS